MSCPSHRVTARGRVCSPGRRDVASRRCWGASTLGRASLPHASGQRVAIDWRACAAVPAAASLAVLRAQFATLSRLAAAIATRASTPTCTTISIFDAAHTPGAKIASVTNKRVTSVSPGHLAERHT